MTWALLNDLPETPEAILDLIWPDIGNPMITGYTGEQKEFAQRMARALKRDRITRQIIGKDEGCTVDIEQHEFLDAWKKNGCAEPATEDQERGEWAATQAHVLQAILDRVSLDVTRELSQCFDSEQWAQIRAGKRRLRFGYELQRRPDGTFQVDISGSMLLVDPY